MFINLCKVLLRNNRFLIELNKKIIKRSFSISLNENSNQNVVQNTCGVNAFVNRTHTCGQLSERDVGREVRLCGWIQYQRLGKFVILRDSYGLTQIIVLKNKQIQKAIAKIATESVVEVRGIVVGRPEKDINPNLSTGRIEVAAEEVLVLNECRNDMPFIIRDYAEVNEKTRLEYRYIDLRHPKMQSILRLRSQVTNKMRHFLTESQDFVEVETPTLFKATPGVWFKLNCCFRN